jgi:hypothetical protein
MALQDTDQLLVNRGGTSHRYTYANVVTDLNNDLDFDEPNLQEVTDQGNHTTTNIEIGGTAGSANTNLNNDGSATFASDVQATGQFDTSNRLLVQRTTAGEAITIDNSGATTASVFNDGRAVFNGRVSGTIGNIADGGAWDMQDSNYWVHAGGNLANPTNPSAGQTGVIFFEAEVTGFGSEYRFPNGTQISPEANSIVPYFVERNAIIRLGNPTQGIN